MFNTNSDYVINKLDTDAIVCRSVTGQLLRITREDFNSDEEFEKWKLWSDTDYHETELRDRAYSDRKTESSIARYIEAQDADWLTMELKAAEQSQHAQLIERMRGFLTDIQFKRIWQRFAVGLELADIAGSEGVSITAVASSIERAVKKLSQLRRRGLL